jgi:hypothetical protein
MKKTYMIPTLQVVKIQPSRILAGSPELTGTYTGGTVLSRESKFSESADDDWE